MTKTFFLTKHVPTTHIYRNHLDEINGLLDEFCTSNRAFEWGVIVKDSKIKNRSDVERYFIKSMSDDMRYYVSSRNQGSMTIDIGDGLVVNIKKGTFALMGLYTSLDEVFKAFRVPLPIALLKKYWMINISIFYIVLLALVFVSGNVWWGLLWVAGLVGLVFLYGYIYDKADDWSDIFPNTKIEFRKFNKRMGVPYVSLLTSTQAVVSFLAAIATIISTLFLLMGGRV